MEYDPKTITTRLGRISKQLDQMGAIFREGGKNTLSAFDDPRAPSEALIQELEAEAAMDAATAVACDAAASNGAIRHATTRRPLASLVPPVLR